MDAPPERAYPVNVRYDREQRMSRLWGLLWFGIIVRALLAIPHLIVLWLLGLEDSRPSGHRWL